MRQYANLLSKCNLLSRLLFVFSFIAGCAGLVPVRAEGGIAMSGSFYQQNFEIPQGASISGPDIYVVVFNNSSELIKVKMSSQTPPGVSLGLSKSEFELAASGQQTILVSVTVGIDAVPGAYDISISAEPYKETAAGIQLIGAASQKASLTVLGEAGLVNVRAMSPSQQPIVTTLRLYRVVSGQEREVSYTETGIMEVKVAPGSFRAASFLGGIQVAEEKFDIAAGEHKEIFLVGATVFFEGFDIVPNYQKKSGELAFVQVVYTVQNLYQRVENAEVKLQISRAGASPVEISLVNLSPLETGRIGLNYSYIPENGWEDGDYYFKLLLSLDGKPYAESPVKNFAAASSAATGTGFSLPVIIGIAAGAVIVLAGGIFFFIRARR